jgi:hypothetical protein
MINFITCVYVQILFQGFLELIVEVCVVCAKPTCP